MDGEWRRERRMERRERDDIADEFQFHIDGRVEEYLQAVSRRPRPGAGRSASSGTGVGSVGNVNVRTAGSADGGPGKDGKR